MAFKQNGPGNCCCGSSICTVTTTLNFRGCGLNPYTFGGAYEIRRASDNMLYYTGTLPASGSETISFTPPVAPPTASAFRVYYFPTYTRFDDNLSSIWIFGLGCGDNGTWSVTLGVRPGFQCCNAVSGGGAGNPSPVPNTLYLSDGAGTTVLTGSGGIWSGGNTISTTGRTTASGCVSTAAATVQVLYSLSCSAQDGGPAFAYAMGALMRTYSYCGDPVTLVEGVRDKDDDPTNTTGRSKFRDEFVAASSAPTFDPFFGSYPDDAVGILGAATVTE